jgi:hypothetical protein
MAASDVTAQSGQAPVGRGKLIDVTDADPETVVSATESGSEEEKIVERGRPKAKRSSGSAADFVRGNLRILAAVALLAFGVTFVILGWYGAAHTNILTEQIPYLISGGLLGSALIIVAGFVANSASLEQQNRELRNDLARAIGAGGARPSNPGDLSIAPTSDGHVLVVPGGRSFHVAGCPLVEGKEATALTTRKAVDSGYASCKLCGAD